MRKIVIIALAFGLTGCGVTAMSNEDIVKQKKICDEAGMDIAVVQNGLTFSIIHVQCVPRTNGASK